jgi:ribosomal protein S18 acetylase RimI-like enzyme
MRFTIRPLGASEFDKWRALRLRALRESPSAFGSRYEDQVVWPRSRWQERTATLAAGDSQVMFVAETRGGHLAGCAGAYVANDGILQVISVWVEPQSRRRGVATLLLDALVAWSRRRGAARLTLNVVSDNLPAIRTYLAYGFKATGASVANEHGRIEVEMALQLTDRPPPSGDPSALDASRTARRSSSDAIE